jgi:hypothetical protein
MGTETLSVFALAHVLTTWVAGFDGSSYAHSPGDIRAPAEQTLLGGRRTIIISNGQCGCLYGMAVPFALGFQIYPWVERVLKVRHYPLAADGLALLLVAVAAPGYWYCLYLREEKSDRCFQGL